MSHIVGAYADTLQEQLLALVMRVRSKVTKLERTTRPRSPLPQRTALFKATGDVLGGTIV